MAGTVSSEYAFPSFACQVQRKLGVTSIPAFDVAAACSGFVFALSVADYSMRAGAWRKVLVIGADALSTMVDWNDRRTAVLFGDGAGAAVMLHEPGPRGVLDTLLRSAGEAWEMLSLRATGIRASADSELRRDPVDTLKMKGPELFKIAVKSMADITRQVVERAGVALDDVKADRAPSSQHPHPQRGRGSPGNLPPKRCSSTSTAMATPRPPRCQSRWTRPGRPDASATTTWCCSTPAAAA